MDLSPYYKAHVAVDIGTGIAFEVRIALAGHFEIDVDSEPDSDAQIS